MSSTVCFHLFRPDAETPETYGWDDWPGMDDLPANSFAYSVHGECWWYANGITSFVVEPHTVPKEYRMWMLVL